MRYSGLVKEVMYRTRLMTFFRHFYSQKKVAILRYHAIVSPSMNYYASPLICLDPEIFEKQIEYFSRNYNIISLDDVSEVLLSGGSFPERAMVLTFDDGYRDNFLAHRIMKKYGVTGTFYISSGCIGDGEPLWLFEVICLVNTTSVKKVIIHGESLFTGTKEEKAATIRRITSIIKSNDLETRERIRLEMREQMSDVVDVDEKASQIMLSWEQVREMAQNGMSIGGHTVTHLNLPNASKEDAVREIVRCKSDIEEQTGTPSNHFSYPNGGDYSYYNDEIKKAVREAGYKTSTTSNNGVATVDSDPYELYRIRVTDDLAEILYAVDCEYPVKRIMRR